MSHWLALAICVAANIGANACFKHLMAGLDLQPDAAGLVSLAMEPWLWGGLSLAGVIVIAYLYALTAVPVGVAYPVVTSVATAGVVLTGALLFGESVKATGLVGIALIAAGVFLVAR